MIALIDALLMHEDSGVERVLILSPVNTIYNWRNEFDRWIPNYECEYNVSCIPSNVCVCVCVGGDVVPSLD